MNRRRRSGFVFAWWDYAVAFAQLEALATGERQHVGRTREGLWEVGPARPPAPRLTLVGVTVP